jgi:hypothetical protein
MSGITLPDEVIAVRDLLKGTATKVHTVVTPYITALHLLVAPEYIATAFRDGWVKSDGKPHNAIVITGAGGFGKERDLPIAQGRVEIKCYSAQPHTARRMGTLVGHILAPPDRRHSGWTAASTRVIAVLDLTNPLYLVEPDTAYPYTTQNGSLRFFERAATA